MSCAAKSPCALDLKSPAIAPARTNCTGRGLPLAWLYSSDGHRGEKSSHNGARAAACRARQCAVPQCAPQKTGRRPGPRAALCWYRASISRTAGRGRGFTVCRLHPDHDLSVRTPPGPGAAGRIPLSRPSLRPTTAARVRNGPGQLADTQHDCSLLGG